VGSVLLDWIKNSKAHTIACLDVCRKNAVGLPKLDEFDIYDSLYAKSKDVLIDLVQHSDIVLLHYWNHPLLTRLLVVDGLPPSRFLCWCHISGLWEPSIIPQHLIDICEKVIFTSTISKQSDYLAKQILVSPNKFDTIHSTRDLKPYLRISEHREYVETAKKLLYIGTVSFSKLHPTSLSIISQLLKLGFQITLVGGPDHNSLYQQISHNIDNIQFVGEVVDIIPYLTDADIFIYPLSQRHYGTGEQSILEAMASGLPVVAFNNPAEAAILQDKETGFLVTSPSEFVKSVISIANSPTLRQQVGTASAKKVQSNYTIAQNTVAFNTLFQTTYAIPKVERLPHKRTLQLPDIDSSLLGFILSSFQNKEYLRSLLKLKNDYERITNISSYIKNKVINGELIWTSATKGSPFHYESYFPYSPSIRYLAERLRHLLHIEKTTTNT